MPGPQQKNEPTPSGATARTDTVRDLRGAFGVQETTSQAGPLNVSVLTRDKPFAPFGESLLDTHQRYGEGHTSQTLHGLRLGFRQDVANQALPLSGAKDFSLHNPLTYRLTSVDTPHPSRPSFLDALGIDQLDGYIALDSSRPRGALDLLSGSTRTQVGADRSGSLFMTVTGSEHLAEFTRSLSSGELSLSALTVRQNGRNLLLEPALKFKEIGGFSTTVGTNVDSLFQTYGFQPLYNHSFSGQGREVTSPLGILDGNLAVNSFRFPSALTTSFQFTSDAGSHLGLVLSTEADRSIIGFRGLRNFGESSVSASVLGIQERTSPLEDTRGVFGTFGLTKRGDAFQMQLDVNGYLTDRSTTQRGLLSSPGSEAEAGASILFTLTPNGAVR